MPKPRLKSLPPDQQSAEQRALYDAVLASPRGQEPARSFVLREDETLTGPFDPWLRSPSLAAHFEKAGMALREETQVGDGDRELAILVVAKAWGADFEWRVHALAALRGGVPLDAIKAIATGDAPALDDPSQQVAYDLAMSLTHHRKVDDALALRASGTLGERGFVEIVMAVGFYNLVSATLESFHPAGPTNDLPDIAVEG